MDSVERNFDIMFDGERSSLEFGQITRPLKLKLNFVIIVKSTLFHSRYWLNIPTHLLTAVNKLAIDLFIMLSVLI